MMTACAHECALLSCDWSVPTMAARYTLLYIMGWQFLMAALFYVQNLTSYLAFAVFFTITGFLTLSVYLFREFSTHIPIELHISALKHLDEKITLFAAFEKVMPMLRTESMSVSAVVGANGSNNSASESDVEEDFAEEATQNATRVGTITTHTRGGDEPSIKRKVTFYEAPQRNRFGSNAISSNGKLDVDHLSVPGSALGDAAPAHSPFVIANEAPRAQYVSPESIADDAYGTLHHPSASPAALSMMSSASDHLQAPSASPPPASPSGSPSPLASMQTSATSPIPQTRRNTVTQAAIQRVRTMTANLAAKRKLSSAAAAAVPRKRPQRPRARSEMHRRSLEFFSDQLKPEFSHPHIHRPPLVHTHSHSHVAHAQLLHLSSVDQSVCPDCLYRHPIWGKMEKDAEVMKILKQREDELIAIQQEEEAIAAIDAEINEEGDREGEEGSAKPDDGYLMELDSASPVSPPAGAMLAVSTGQTTEPTTQGGPPVSSVPHVFDEHGLEVATRTKATADASAAVPASGPLATSAATPGALPDIVIRLDRPSAAEDTSPVSEERKQASWRE
jgi:hypothetical protein